VSAAAIDALVCCVEGSLPLASLSAASVGRDEVVYRLDERHGQIECSAQQCGVFAVRGQLAGFACVLAFNRAEMRVLRFDLTAQLTSFEMSALEMPGDVPMARSLDGARHPDIRFRSTAVAPCGSSRHVVRGLLEFGGVTRLQALDLTVGDRRTDPITETDVADLTFTGRFQQTALGVPLIDIVMANALDLRLAVSVELEG
jgi:polyisoprenoid-binding protein YceI